MRSPTRARSLRSGQCSRPDIRTDTRSSRQGFQESGTAQICSVRSLIFVLQAPTKTAADESPCDNQSGSDRLAQDLGVRAPTKRERLRTIDRSNRPTKTEIQSPHFDLQLTAAATNRGALDKRFDVRPRCECPRLSSSDHRNRRGCFASRSNPTLVRLSLS